MQLPIYQIDAFASEVFGGNPAAVCPLEFWLEDNILQKIAEENNLSETAICSTSHCRKNTITFKVSEPLPAL